MQKPIGQNGSITLLQRTSQCAKILRVSKVSQNDRTEDPISLESARVCSLYFLLRK